MMLYLRSYFLYIKGIIMMKNKTMKDLEKEQRQLKQQLRYWQIEKKLLLQKQDLEQEKKKIKNRYKEQRKKLTTSKFLMLFLFISCSMIELFTIILTFKSMNLGYVDFSALQTLIAAVVAQVVGFAVYSLKSLKENTIGGIVYQSAMIQAQKKINQENNNQEAVG